MIKRIFTVSVVVLTIFWAVGLAAFVPTAQATTVSSGDLIKASLPAVYYYGADGKRYVFPDQKTYMTWYSDFSGVKTITDGELAAISIGGNVTSKPGVKMVKITTDPKVYAVAANGALRWVTTESIAASLYGSNWGKMVNDVPDPFFVNYTVGTAINNVTDYTPATATAGAQSINVDKGLAGATTGGVLSLALASDTPAPATVAAGASANFTKIILSAGATAVKVKSLYVTRSGLSSNDDVQNIKLVAANGATVGSVASLGANSKALVTFVPSLEIAANTSQTLYIRASIGAGAFPGNTVALAIAAASDVVLDAGTATGAFPIVGNYMSIVVLANLGGAIVDANALPPDSMPDAGAKRVQVSQFEIQAGSNENLTVESLSLMEAGTAANADYANIELFSLTESRTLGTVSSWDANSRATYGPLNIVIPKGSKHIFQVYTDVVSGSGNNLNVDLTDGNTDALVVVKGNTYGFYLTPDITNIGSLPPIWDGKGTAQTVGRGLLNVTRDISSPATGNITQAGEQSLVTFAYEVRGEDAKVTSTMITFGGNVIDAAVINAKLVDETGTVVAGPKAIADTGAGVTINADTVTFTETYIVPTGTHKYTLKVDILSAAVSTTQIIAGILNAGAPVLDITATGMNTRDAMNISAAPVIGNLQTILGVALTTTTMTQPASRLVSAGTQNFVWATASLDATASGEDIRVSAVTVNDTYNVPAGAGTDDATAIQNVSIWADLTSASSARGDAYETKVSNNEQFAVGDDCALTAPPSCKNKAISLTQVITVPKGTFVKIAVVGDLSTLADTGTPSNHTLSIPAVTATGKSTGNTPPAAAGGFGQVMTVTGAGTLTETLGAASPLAQILVSGAQKQAVAVFKLAANNVENLDLDDIMITDAGTFTNPVADAWYLYSSKRDDGGSTADPVAIAAGGALPTFILADNTVVIPANGSVTLTVKADIAPVDGVTVLNGDQVQATLNAAIDTHVTGKASGAQTTGNTPAPGFPLNATTHVAYASKPTITLNASSPTSPLVPNANSLLAIFNIAADAAEDISFTSTGAANQLIITLAANCTGGGADTNVKALLKDEGGLTLSTAAEADDACRPGSRTFSTWTNDLIIAKGTTKKVYLYGDTSAATAVGNSVQAYILDTAANVTWSINLDGGNYATGDITVRGNLYANALAR